MGQRVEAELVGFFLGVVRVEKQSPASHGLHVWIFATDVDVDYFLADQLVVTLHIELDRVDVLPRLQQDWQGVLEELAVGDFKLLHERLQLVRLV